MGSPDDLPKVAKGDSARVSAHIGKPKDALGAKGYHQQWSTDIYTINSLSCPKKKLASVSFTLKDSSGKLKPRRFWHAYLLQIPAETIKPGLVTPVRPAATEFRTLGFGNSLRTRRSAFTIRQRFIGPLACSLAHRLNLRKELMAVIGLEAKFRMHNGAYHVPTELQLAPYPFLSFKNAMLSEK